MLFVQVDVSNESPRAGWVVDIFSLQNSLKADSHDPILGSNYFSVIVSAHRNGDSGQQLL